MSLSYIYAPQIWPSFLTVLLLLSLAVYSGHHRSVPGAFPFMIACLMAAAWAVGSVMEYAAIDLATKIFWVKFQVFWQLPTVTSMTCFVLEYAWPGRWLTRRNMAILSIAPSLVLGLIASNDVHHLMWSGFRMDGSVIAQTGPGSWIAILYSFGLVTLNFCVFVWLFLHSPQHRWPVVIMTIGSMGARILYVIEKIFVLQSTLPLDVIGLAFTDVLYAIALSGFRLFDPIPLARQMAVEQLITGMLVLDSQGKIVFLNPAAVKLLGLPEKHLLGCSIHDLLPVEPEVLQAVTTGQVEFSLPAGNRDGERTGLEKHDFQLELSALNDWRGLAVGRLLMLRDMTEQKRSQAQFLEQQRALAMLHEREQLSRELHDSIGQVLGYTGFQLEVVHDRIQDGQAAISSGQAADAQTQMAEAGNQLTRLSRIVESAHADLREYILNLRSTPSDQQPFFASLQHYLDGFSQNYCIRAELSVNPGIEEVKLDLEAQMQLFRIIQEALSNARKHAGASCVQVTFGRQEQSLCIRIRDNGRGFDPALAVGEGGSHFGLQFMQERTEQIGGVLRIDSAPGRGTQVIVEVPWRSYENPDRR